MGQGTEDQQHILRHFGLSNWLLPTLLPVAAFAETLLAVITNVRITLVMKESQEKD